MANGVLTELGIHGTLEELVAGIDFALFNN